MKYIFSLILLAVLPQVAFSADGKASENPADAPHSKASAAAPRVVSESDVKADSAAITLFEVCCQLSKNVEVCIGKNRKYKKDIFLSFQIKLSDLISIINADDFNQALSKNVIYDNSKNFMYFTLRTGEGARKLIEIIEKHNLYECLMPIYRDMPISRLSEFYGLTPEYFFKRYRVNDKEGRHGLSAAFQWICMNTIDEKAVKEYTELALEFRKNYRGDEQLHEYIIMDIIDRTIKSNFSIVSDKYEEAITKFKTIVAEAEKNEKAASAASATASGASAAQGSAASAAAAVPQVPSSGMPMGGATASVKK